MREIKFRIWDKRSQRFETCVYETGKDCYLFIGRLGYVTAFNCYGDEIDFEDGRFIIQQFTGLLDKNKNPIYEGDIVDYRYDGMSESDKERYADLLVSPVYWDYERWRIKYSAASYAWHIMEIVGNIFESPNLLK